MAPLTMDISMSLDGFIAGPNFTLERPLGDGGERLHEWPSSRSRVVESPYVTHLKFSVKKTGGAPWASSS